MSTKSREHLYGTTIRMSAERAKEARKEANRLACEAWNYRMLGYKGPAQPSPTLGDALNLGHYCVVGNLRTLGAYSALPSGATPRPFWATTTTPRNKTLRCVSSFSPADASTRVRMNFRASLGVIAASPFASE